MSHTSNPAGFPRSSRAGQDDELLDVEKVDGADALWWRDNSYFNMLDEMISLPRFEKSEVASKSINKAKTDLAHEYAHYLQSISSRFGFEHFRAGTSRLITLLNALQRNQTFAQSLSNWRNLEGTKETREFADEEQNYRTLSMRLTGGWASKVSSGAAMTVRRARPGLDVPGLSTSVEHILRTFDNISRAVPILGKSVCEAHAESFAELSTDVSSFVFQQLDQEDHLDLLFYTTLYGFVQRTLPSLRPTPVLFALTDHALMWKQTDEAFLRGLHWIEQNISEDDSAENLRLELFRNSNEAFAVDELLLDIQGLRKHLEQGENDVTQMLIGRLNRSQSALEARRENPAYFMRGKEEPSQSYFERLTDRFGVARVRVKDGYVRLGTVSTKEHDQQGYRASVSHLLQAVTDTLIDGDPSCPKYRVCELEKDPACHTKPWARPLINGEACEFSVAGALLGWFEDKSTSEASLEPDEK